MLMELLWWLALPQIYVAAVVGFGCGLLVAGLLRDGREARDDRWQARPTREWDESRWREGSAMDGHWRGVRWLPRHDDED